MPLDPRVLHFRNLAWLTLIGACIFAAPATMPLSPAAIPTAIALTAWCLIVTILGLSTLKQVGFTRSGILAPILVLLLAAQTTTFALMAAHNIALRPAANPQRAHPSPTYQEP